MSQSEQPEQLAKATSPAYEALTYIRPYAQSKFSRTFFVVLRHLFIGWMLNSSQFPLYIIDLNHSRYPVSTLSALCKYCSHSRQMSKTDRVLSPRTLLTQSELHLWSHTQCFHGIHISRHSFTAWGFRLLSEQPDMQFQLEMYAMEVALPLVCCFWLYKPPHGFTGPAFSQLAWTTAYLVLNLRKSLKAPRNPLALIMAGGAATCAGIYGTEYFVFQYWFAFIRLKSHFSGWMW
jgi:hypothetical protein